MGEGKYYIANGKFILYRLLCFILYQVFVFVFSRKYVILCYGEKMKIGNIEIKNRIIMAPMAGITNVAFRKIIKEFGAGLVVSEMVSDKALCYGNQKRSKC